MIKTANLSPINSTALLLHVCSVLVTHQRSKVTLAAFPRGESDMAAARQSAGVPAAEVGTPECPCGGGEHRSGSVLSQTHTHNKVCLC